MTATVLIVAGSDPTGGAGIVRDVATVTALGLRACVTVTAVTVQTDHAVRHVEAMPATLVAAQMEAALEAGNVGAVKIGMLPGVEAILAVAAVLARHLHLPAVVDPVLSASSGASLSADGGIAALRDHLFPLARLVTPNLPELARHDARNRLHALQRHRRRPRRRMRSRLRHRPGETARPRGDCCSAISPCILPEAGGSWRHIESRAFPRIAVNTFSADPGCRDLLPRE